jgi:hypothetical protein
MSPTFRRLVGALICCGLAAAMGGGTAVAQDVIPLPQPGIVLEVAPAVDGNVIELAPQVHALSLSADALVGETVFFAQPWGSDPASLLDMGNVQKELDLIDEQKDRIREAQRKSHDAMQKHFAEMRALHTRRIRDLQDSEQNTQPKDGAARGAAGGGPGPVPPRIVEQPEEFKKSQERVKQLRDQLAKEVEDVLLPHQKKRLEEIALRMKMKQRGTSGSLVESELAKTLDIDDTQKERIRRRAMEVQKELEEKIAKLREEARDEILSELSPEQHRKLKDLLGADFDDQPQYAPPRVRNVRRRDAKEKPASEPKAEAEPKTAPDSDDRGS